MKNKDLTKLMLSSGREHKCSECKIPPFYNQKPITLQVDHIDGVNTNNNMENLRFLCPNCHSQTATWCGKNRNKTNRQTNNRIRFGHMSAEELQNLWKGKSVKQFCAEEKIGYIGFILYLRTRNIYVGNFRKHNLTDEQKEYIVSQLCAGISRRSLSKELNIPTWTLNRLYYAEKLHEKVVKTCKENNEEYTIASRKPKINWPPVEFLLEKLSRQSYKSVARELGVADNTIRKHLKRCGYDPQTLKKTTGVGEIRTHDGEN